MASSVRDTLASEIRAFSSVSRPKNGSASDRYSEIRSSASSRSPKASSRRLFNRTTLNSSGGAMRATNIRAIVWMASVLPVPTPLSSSSSTIDRATGRPSPVSATASNVFNSTRRPSSLT